MQPGQTLTARLREKPGHSGGTKVKLPGIHYTTEGLSEIYDKKCMKAAVGFDESNQGQEEIEVMFIDHCSRACAERWTRCRTTTSRPSRQSRSWRASHHGGGGDRCERCEPKSIANVMNITTSKQARSRAVLQRPSYRWTNGMPCAPRPQVRAHADCAS
ncbi:unnamed protein product [Phytophthora fragariaefolia]|uniref:Unnamed protein product n=1 Tax=Phytophthora fragariaefolia TaxID=1490495 RepID=A0A9W6Y166_9STRA|nr:unnamed protein product [Phytophthora fragariaefolia]